MAKDSENLLPVHAAPAESPLDAPFPSKRMLVNLGPSHPAMHGTVRAVVELDGETIHGMKLDIGFLHRGFEKTCENVTWTQVFPYTDRLNYVSSIMNNVGYAMAVEKLCDLAIPDRAKYLRVLTSELHRMCDHFTLVSAMGLELGAMTVLIYGMEARDVPDGWAEKLERTLDRAAQMADEIDRLLTRNRIVIDRCRGTGVISRADAIDYGFTGPCLRASGEPYDVRKASPYLVYDRLDFEVPVGTNGDNFDRYLVRMEELKQSERIVRQCLAQMEPGAIASDDPRFVLPPKPEVYGSIEGAMAHFKIIMEGIQVPAGEAYAFVEAANGELGFYAVSDGSGRPYKLGVRAPGWNMLMALPQIMEGRMLADLIPTFDTVNMIGGEVEQ
jgi:NADH-quinone oxidoreductase subunit D